MKRLVAICGYPQVGKSEVQDLIAARYGFTPIDDGRPLRDAAKHLYNLDEWHVSTQEGKASEILVGTRYRTVRDLLGELGCYLERDDPYHLPRIALEKAMIDDPEGRFVFGSVRLDQPRFFKCRGDALIVEVRRAGTSATTTSDCYERDMIDVTIENTPDMTRPDASRRALAASVAEALDPLLAPPSLAGDVFATAL